MELVHWVVEHWSHVIENVGVATGLFVFAVSYHEDKKVRRVEAFIKMTERHASLWIHYYSNPHLAGLRDPKRDMVIRPLSGEEAHFVNFLFNHLDGVIRASKAGISVRPENLSKDIRAFLALPAPRAAWEEMKPMLDSHLVAFIERALAVRT